MVTWNDLIASIGPSSLTIPRLGWMAWVAIGFVVIIGGVLYSIKHGRILVNPPPYFGCAINRDPFPSIAKREYRDPRTGKHEEITVIVNGVEQKILKTEKYWEPHGLYVGSKINYPGHFVDQNDWIVPSRCRHDSETGRDNPEIDKDKDVPDEPSSGTAATPVVRLTRRIKKVFRNIRIDFEEKFGYQYIGNWWFVEWAATHDWIWWERGADGIPFRRRNRQRYFPLAVKTSAVEIEGELIDAFGFPWKAEVSVQTKIRNIGIAVIKVPDSMDQLIKLVRGNITEAWQSLAIIDYEGLKEQIKTVNGKIIPPTPNQVSAVAGQSEAKIGANTHIQKLLFQYLCDSGEWTRIMNQLGREVVAIIVEGKSLAGGYAEAIAKVRKAELSKQEMITLSEGEKQSMINIAKGMAAQIKKVAAGGAAAISMVESGMFNENVPPMDPVQKLVTATLYPDVAKIQREIQRAGTEKKKEPNASGGGVKNRKV